MRLSNVLHLGVKELRSLSRDPLLFALILFAFTVSVYTAATAMPETLHEVPIAIVDEDQSPLSGRIAGAFYPPYFQPPTLIAHSEMDPRLDAGLDTFALVIPPEFQRDLLAGRRPQLQLNVDATRVSQAFTGSGYVQAIVSGEVEEFLRRHRAGAAAPVELALRNRFNPALRQGWFGAIAEVVSNVTMIAIILAGAALIREREHGTIEHLLVMPVTPAEIMVSKIWAMGLVVFVAVAFSLTVVVEGWLGVPVAGSIGLFLLGAALHIFACTTLGIFLATVARSMPQFGLLLILTMLPMQTLSGGMTPRESMPELVQQLMLVAPTTHYIALSEAILFRGAEFSMVWPQLLALVVIGVALFLLSLGQFRKSLA
ncbi:MAG: ABC transporter permease [Xanthomonadaceae bacterium]|nr:ABC transporter permease [Xanthomonadaceae bacterium]